MEKSLKPFWFYNKQQLNLLLVILFKPYTTPYPSHSSATNKIQCQQLTFSLTI